MKQVHKIIARKAASGADWVYEGKWGMIICSKCRAEALFNLIGKPDKSTYCPHCGAKMDGGDSE